MKKVREGSGRKGIEFKNKAKKRNDKGRKERGRKRDPRSDHLLSSKIGLKETDLKWGLMPVKASERNLFPRFQKPFVFLLPADRKVLPKVFPGIQELGNHIGNLNQQIVVFHSLPIMAEKML